MYKFLRYIGRCPLTMLNKTEQASQAELVSPGALSCLEKFHIFKSLQKIVQNINHLAKLCNFLSKVGTPNGEMNERENQENVTFLSL